MSSDNTAPILSRADTVNLISSLRFHDCTDDERAAIHLKLTTSDAGLRIEIQRLTEERIKALDAELSALRAELAETRERSNKNHDAALGFQNRALNAESLLASATDLMNTCAREWNVAQAANESGIKDLFDRLWSEMSCRYFDKRDDEAKANQDAVALRAELEAVKAAEGELEVWLCPVHKSLDKLRKLEPFDNCVACIRAERNELRVRLEEAERDELHEIEQRDYREEKFGELVALFGDVQLEFSNLRGFDEIISDCCESLKVRNDAIARAYEKFRKIAEFIPETPQSHEETLEQVTMMAEEGERDMGDVVSEWERINGELYPHESIDAAISQTAQPEEKRDS